MMRPGPHEMELPANVFWWQAPSGSRLLTFRIAGTYMTRAEDHVDHIRLAITSMPPELDETMCFFGVGNHGGGPTKRQIENIEKIATESEEWDVRFSDPASYFAAIRDEAASLPTVAEELQFHAIGCYSVVSELKRAHRQAENGLLVAERMAALAELWAQQPVPAARMRTLWHELCFNQFHDTLGGSSIKRATDDAVRALHGIIVSAEEIGIDAGRALATRIDTSLPTAAESSSLGKSAAARDVPNGAVVIFNPTATPFTDYVEYEPWTEWVSWPDDKWGLLDESGEPVPYQLLEREAAMANIAAIPGRLLFQANVSPMGYRVYHYAAQQAQTLTEGSCTAAAYELQNDLLHIRLDPATGNIVSCIDKATDVELVGPGGWNVPQVVDDPSDTWTHRLAGYGEAADAFGEPQISIYETGPLQASLVIERRYEGSVWQQQICVRHGVPEILIRNSLNWNGHWTLLKLAFDVATDAPTAVHDIPFGWIERPTNGREFPTHMWMDVSGPAAADKNQPIGAALLNDGKYGCDVSGSIMRLTVLRSPPYAFHEPHAIGDKQHYDWIDQGFQEFAVAVRPHVGEWQEANVIAHARRLNQPPVLITMHGHPGELPPIGSLLALSTPDMELTAFKQADDDNGYVARVADCYGQGATGAVTFSGSDFPLEVAPHDVVTLRFAPADGGWHMTICDMLERDDLQT